MGIMLKEKEFLLLFPFIIFLLPAALEAYQWWYLEPNQATYTVRRKKLFRVGGEKSASLVS